MSKELKNSVLKLLKESGVLEITDDPAIKEIQTINNDDISTEIKHTQVYRDLVDNLDRLMVIEQSQKGMYDSVKDELMKSGRLAHLIQNGELKDEELLKYLKQIQQIRRLVIESSTMTLPVLRSVHQVEGLTTKETGIVSKIEKRDELTDKIIKLQSKINKNTEKLIKLTYENLSKFETSKQLTSLLIETKRNDNTPQDPKQKAILEKNLAEAKEKSYNLAEQIQAFIVENGLNWADDEQLREIVLYCGEIYR